MKKITLLLAACAISLGVTAQDRILSHATSQDFVQGAVACASGVNGTTENNYWRAYLPSEFNESGTISLQGGEFYVSFNDVGATGSTVDVVLSAVLTDGIFPDGPTDEVIASATITIGEGDDGQLIEFDFDSPVNITADTEVALKLAIPDGVDEDADGNVIPTGFDCRVGQNDEDETAPSYISTEGSCGLTTISTLAEVGADFEASILLNLRVGDEVLGINDVLLSQVSVFPNPATDVVNVRVPNNVQVESVSVYDLLGKKANVSVSNGQVNIAELATGVYLLDVKTSVGTLTEKIIKK